MAFNQGEMYTCDQCGAEIQVTRGANAGSAGDQNPTCCCGAEMHSAGGSAQAPGAGATRGHMTE